MDSNLIKQKLDRLAEFRAQRDAIALEKQRVLDAIYTSEIKARVADVEEEFSTKTEGVAANIARLELEIKSEVAAHGESVRGTILHAVFAKGRVTWDTKSLDGYAKAHPELASFRKEGEPSVSIRATANGSGG